MDILHLKELGDAESVVTNVSLDMYLVIHNLCMFRYLTSVSNYIPYVKYGCTIE